MIPQNPIYILLHNIRSVHNTGSIFRTADCAGVTKIFLSGHTPAPLDRFKRKRNDFAKVALGAEDSVPWEYFESPVEAIEAIGAIEEFEKDSGIIVAVEQNEASIDYKTLSQKLKPGQPILLIFGNEVGGVEQELLKVANIIVEIRQFGAKESLNVSVAAGIILFSLR